MYSGNSHILLLNVTDAGISTGTWYHVAIERYGNLFTIFRDGVAKGTTTQALTYPNYTGEFQIGGENTAFSQFLNGFLDETRISNIDRYQGSGFTPSTTEYCGAGISDMNFRANGRGIGMGIGRGMFYSKQNFEKSENGLYVPNKKICRANGGYFK